MRKSLFFGFVLFFRLDLFLILSAVLTGLECNSRVTVRADRQRAYITKSQVAEAASQNTLCADCRCADCVNNICPLACFDFLFFFLFKSKIIKMVLPDCLKSAVRGFIQGNIIPERQMVSRLRLPLLTPGLPLAPWSTRIPRGHCGDSPGLHLELTPVEGKVRFGGELGLLGLVLQHGQSQLLFSTFFRSKLWHLSRPIAKLLLCSCSGRANCWGSTDPANHRFSNKTRNPSAAV